jgi:vacuolar-type H+-ATPase subunit H
MTVSLCLVAGLMAGCSLIGDPKVPAPPGLSVPEGTPLTVQQYEKQIQAAQVREEAEQKAAERKALREISQLERAAKSASDEAISEASDRAAEIAEDVAMSATTRLEKIQVLTAGLDAARADIEARRSLVEKAFEVTGMVAQNSGIPGLGLIAGPVLGALGLMFGVKRGGDAKAEKAASDAHDDAWEESKKEMLQMLAMARGSSVPPPTHTS